MRVVGGEARGRPLKGPKHEGTRPIIDRVKTALFDILSWHIEDTRFLDLFAGVGGVGIEAISRGAARAAFVELDQGTYKILGENLASTRLGDRAETLRMDAFAFLASAHAQGRHFDYVYVAPPQYHGLAARALAQLDRAPLTEPGGTAIVQIHPRERSDLGTLTLTTFTLSDERRYGNTLLMFYQHRAPSPPRADAPGAAQESQL